MSYKLNEQEMNKICSRWNEDHLIFAPVRKKSFGRFSDTDEIIYDFVDNIDQVVFDQKSDYSFKEAFLPLSETLFFFTEDQVKEADSRKQKAIVFLRSCDFHAIKRLDEIYLKNGFEDFFYKRLREGTKFIIMGCANTFDNCFCTHMDTNISIGYDGGMEKIGGDYYFENNLDEWQPLLDEAHWESVDFVTSHVESSDVELRIPETVSTSVFDSEIWDEYDYRCINCGRCNFACPTCTCFTMQDVFYTDNDKVGERRRVGASCMVDGFTDVAGGASYRKKNGQRMRFRTLHKFYDFKKRFGYHMCVGCGRCDDICPQYIAITHAINKVSDYMEGKTEDAKGGIDDAK